MKRELTPKEIVFSTSCKDVMKNTDNNKLLEDYIELEKIKKALTIKKNGFNVYYIDSFSNEKIQILIKQISSIYEKYQAPKDICYVTSKESVSPKVVFVENGKGVLLKDLLEEYKDNYYECIDDFYTTTTLNEKQAIIENINEERNKYITKLIEMAKSKNFDVKATSGGFVFIPLKDSENEMTEEEYDNLEEGTRESIEKQVSKLKIQAEEILEKLKNIEILSIEKLKDIYKNYLKNSMQKYKDDILLEFISNDTMYRYLIEMFEDVDDDLVECYTINLENDEESIKKIFEQYKINVIVDNSNFKYPKVLYEDDPSISNLIGNIEFRNQNGVYITDVSLISAGSLIKANEGCFNTEINITNQQWEWNWLLLFKKGINAWKSRLQLFQKLFRYAFYCKFETRIYTLSLIHI
eukprot:TRINITY_DN2604_c0_g1_i7.p1 TRINITY_DN2604_c0_g1~~TRINITY_DN2604_c0_g1_i7.p1  ORF type:complete len:410 (-),score=78.66 TRINITY_DN2604_c0_g1_i7:120-1349(-)